jgi:hypothetical protein
LRHYFASCRNVLQFLLILTSLEIRLRVRATQNSGLLRRFLRRVCVAAGRDNRGLLEMFLGHLKVMLPSNQSRVADPCASDVFGPLLGQLGFTTRP